MGLTSIQEEIVHLSSTERAMLIDILWESSMKSASGRLSQNGPLSRRNGSTLLSGANCRHWTDRQPFEIFARLSGNDAIPVYVLGAYGAEAGDTLVRAT
jgi:hypothetical protein